jgi:hypothetical protein
MLAYIAGASNQEHLKPEIMRVTFEEFSPTHDFFDYRGLRRTERERAQRKHVIKEEFLAMLCWNSILGDLLIKQRVRSQLCRHRMNKSPSF